MTPTLYGIPNCDTVRKARRWLDEAGVAYSFHDFRSDGLDRETVAGWIDAKGWETVVNRRSTSWKSLDPKLRETMDAQGADAGETPRAGYRRHAGIRFYASALRRTPGLNPRKVAPGPRFFNVI